MNGSVSVGHDGRDVNKEYLDASKLAVSVRIQTHSKTDNDDVLVRFDKLVFV